MDIFEMSAQLGDALKQDERLVRLANAKTAYEGNTELQKHLVEYEVQQRAMQGEITKEERDLHFVDIIQKRIDLLYRAIMEDPDFKELNEAQAAVNELMNQINSTITYHITGEKPSEGCTHNCASCGGCH